MENWENKVYEGIHYSRFIASWTKKNGKIVPAFKGWLKSLDINGKTMPDDVVHEIWQLATNGKLELETDAYFYMRDK